MRSKMPQSNQRGIETIILVGSDILRMRSLNRTSVGLKLAESTCNPFRGFGLNRTSVGLKLAHFGVLGGGEEAPQSNQRGIETSMGASPATVPAGRASIEPAWD